MYIDVKETTKKYSVVRVKEACENELAILGTHFKFKENLEGKLVAANGDLWALLDFRTPHFFY